MINISQEALIECQPIPVSIGGTKEILSQMENCICLINKKNGIKGTGFFCKIPVLNQSLPVLITNNHILDENDIENDKIIDLYINNKLKKKIKIDDSRKKFTEKNIDITIIEIKPNKDGINNYLEYEELNYTTKSIYILHNPRGKLSVSYGLIKKIDDNKEVIEHYCNTEKGSSGSPILSLETFKLIGIHFGYDNKKKVNCGTSFKCAIKSFKEYINKTENKYINKKVLYKIKTKPRYQLNCNRETIKLNDIENNHFNNYKNNEYHKFYDKNNNKNKRLDDNNHKIITASNCSILSSSNYTLSFSFDKNKNKTKVNNLNKYISYKLNIIQIFLRRYIIIKIYI